MTDIGTYIHTTQNENMLHLQGSLTLAIILVVSYGKIAINGNNKALCVRVTKSRLYESQVRGHVVHSGFNVSSSAHDCGGVVNGGNTMAAI